jgi:cytoskeletal protein RodZ
MIGDRNRTRKFSFPVLLTKRTYASFLAVALLLITAHRLPAPIQEVPESPTPAPEESVKAKPKRTVKPKATSESSESSTKNKAPSPTPKGQASSTQPRYAGTWRGTINCSIWGDVEHIIVIDDAQKTMTVSKASNVAGGATGTAATFISVDGLAAKLPGLNGTWALKPDPDGKTARVKLTGFMLNSSAVFRRQP